MIRMGKRFRMGISWVLAAQLALQAPAPVLAEALAGEAAPEAVIQEAAQENPEAVIREAAPFEEACGSLYEDDIPWDAELPAVGASGTPYPVPGGKIYFDKSTGTVTSSDHSVTEAVIPERIDGVTVTAIGNNAFNDRTGLKKVTMPDTVTRIGDNAFTRCTELQSVVLSSALTSIGAYAFRNDESLESCTWKGGEAFDPFQEGLSVEIGSMAFTDCFFLRPDFSNSYKRGMYYKQLHSNSTRKLLKGKAAYLSDIIVIAKSQLGYHEGNSYDQMDGTAYGYGDYSEYTCWWGEPGQMWCGEFVAWCIAMASVPEEIFKRKYQTPKIYTWEETSYAGGSYSLKQGDVLHFDYEGGNHVCLVYGTRQDGDTLKIDTLDGNHSNDVSRGLYVVDKKTGAVTNEWVGKNARIAKIYAPDASKSVVDSLTYYKLTFDVNGGDKLEGLKEEGWNMEPDEKEITYGASYGIMPIPTREGYIFDGWYTRANEGEEGDHKVTSYRIFKEHADQTLYARWVEYDSGKEPVIDGGSEKTYTDIRDISHGGSTWKIDAPTGTITKIPDSWTGGEIPSSLGGIPVTAIADKACYQNQNITEVTIPEGVKELGVSAFFQCPKLKRAVIPESMEKIGAQSFMYCYELEDITFTGDHLDDIRKDRYAFYRTPWFHGDFSEGYQHGPWYQELMRLVDGTERIGDPELSLQGGTDALKDALKIGESQLGYHEGDEPSELTGLNSIGNGEYAEPVFFSGSPDYLWFKNVPMRSYGGWCGQYCSWVLRMAGIPDYASGMLGNDEENDLKWEDLTLAGKGGTHVLQAGDVLHMRIGHYCIVTDVEEKDGWVYVKTLNGNHGNEVCWDTYRLDPKTGWRHMDGTKDNYDVTNILIYRGDKLLSGKKYDLFFDANGGIVNKTSKTVYEGGFYGLLPLTKRTGHIFRGWNTAPDGSGETVSAYRPVRKSNANVTVYAQWEANSTRVTGIEMGMDKKEIKVGETFTPTASVQPDTASNKKIIWRSADEGIARIDENNQVQGVSLGVVNIIAATEDGGYQGRILVEVTDGSEKYPMSDGTVVKFLRDTGTITGIVDAKEEVVIDDMIDGTNVLEIGRQAFQGESGISKVTLPDTLERIGVSAFAYSGLTEIQIPASVREIRGYAFSNCSRLGSLTFEAGIKYIYSCAFHGCTSLEEVWFPNTVRCIYTRAFDDCESLKKAAFQGSREKISSLADNAFPENTELVFGTEDLPEEDPYIPSPEPVTPGSYEVGTQEKDYTFDESTGTITKAAWNVTNAQIPDSIGGVRVKKIGESAFENRYLLKSLSIPNTVEEIGRHAFFNCPELETVYVPDSVKTIADNAFGFNKDSLTSSSAATIGNLSKLTIGRGIESLGGYLCQKQYALKTVRILRKKEDVTLQKYSFMLSTNFSDPKDQQKWAQVLYIDDLDPEDCEHYLVHHPAGPAACTEYGSDKEYWKCAICGKLFADGSGLTGVSEGGITLTPPLGHDWGEWRVIKEPTKTEPGIKEHTCKRCGQTEQVTKNEEDESPVEDPSGGKGFVAYFSYDKTRFPYTGMARRPEVTVKNNGDTLTPDRDYVLTYKNNVKVTKEGETALAIVTGKGEYTGKVTLPFTIIKQSISSQDILAGSLFAEDGKAVLPVLTYNGTVLKKNVDYSLEESGKEVLIKGRGNFDGERRESITKLPKSELAKRKIKVQLSLSEKKVYDGNPKTLTDKELMVKSASGNELKEGKDYAISYSANVDAGTVKAVISGIGDYCGSVKKSFKILPYAGLKSTVSTDQASYVYRKNGVKPKLTVMGVVSGNQAVLSEGKDYKVSYSNNKKPGTGKFKIIFLGNYKGAKYEGDRTYPIEQAVLSGVSPNQVIAGDMLYAKKAKYQPKAWVVVSGNLLAAADYTREYSLKDKLEAGEGETISGNLTVAPKASKNAKYKGGPVTISYNVVSAKGKTDINGAKVVLMQGSRRVGSLGYTGLPLTLPQAAGEKEAPIELCLKIGRDKTLTGSEVAENFDIYYADNVEKGKAAVILKAKAGKPYIGACAGTFKIVSQKIGK